MQISTSLFLHRRTRQLALAAVLGVAREDDLPGADVPQTYFRYLQNRDFAPIQRILEHNLQDVVSLAQLFFFLCKLYDKPETAAFHQVSRKPAGEKADKDETEKAHRGLPLSLPPNLPG